MAGSQEGEVERDVLRQEMEECSETDDEDLTELCCVHPYVRVMVDIIDVSILVVIMARLRGMCLITL